MIELITVDWRHNRNFSRAFTALRGNQRGCFGHRQTRSLARWFAFHLALNGFAAPYVWAHDETYESVRQEYQQSGFAETVERDLAEAERKMRFIEEELARNRKLIPEAIRACDLPRFLSLIAGTVTLLDMIPEIGLSLQGIRGSLAVPGYRFMKGGPPPGPSPTDPFWEWIGQAGMRAWMDGGKLENLDTSLHAELLRTLQHAIEDYLWHCCGREGCGDPARTTTGDASARQPGSRTPDASNRPRDSSRSGGGDPTGVSTGTDPTGSGISPPPPAIGRSSKTGEPRSTDSQHFTPEAVTPHFESTVPPEPPPPDAIPQPPETGAHPPTRTDAGARLPQDSAPPITADVASCCESCPSNKQERYYVPIAPDTDCQPGDVRRDDLSVEAGTCANPLFEAGEDLGPWTSGPACCSRQTAQMLYDTVPSADNVTSQVGSVLRGGGCPDDPCRLAPASPEGERPKEVEVSILSTAPGPNGRNWVPEHPVLRAGKERLKPCAQSKFYVTKEATGSGREAATAIFSAISAEYAQEAARAADSPGTACPSHSGGTRSRAQEAREKAAAAAGLALLASQAKGQITGLRATFNVTGKEDLLSDAKLDADIVNEVTQKKVRMTMPVRFESSRSSR